MTYDPETLCTLISMQLSRFAGSGNYWTIYDPRWPGMIAIRLEQLGERTSRWMELNSTHGYRRPVLPGRTSYLW